MPSYDQTLDWTAYWERADDIDREDADPTGEYLVDPLLEFFERRGVPSSYADIGCGPGSAAFAVADRYPETTVVGYDAAEPVLETNRARADERGDENPSFERAVLPDFDPDRQFEVVSSCYTLCYLPEIERAVQALYDAVEPGGYLVITYHNEYARSLFAEMAERPHEYLDKNSAWDPDHFAERFAGVIAGESILSYRKIHDLLGAWPQSLWSAVEAERYPAWRQNPLVFVPKTGRRSA